jgi:cell division septum initiation protein DivIVA
MALPLPKKGKDSSGPAPTDWAQTSLSRRLLNSYELREEVAQLEDAFARLREQEALISKTLLAATSHAMTIREEARREAELTLRKARAELESRMALADRVDRERMDAERELTRLREVAHEMQRGLASFLTQTLEQLREAETGAEELPSTGGVQAALVSALEAAIEREGEESRPGSSDVMPSQASR